MKHCIIEPGLIRACALIGIAAMATGCGGWEDGGSSSGGASGSGGWTATGAPPAPPGNGIPGDGAGAVLAITQMYLGDTLRNGVKDASAWKRFGYDLDGIKSTRETTNHCQPVEHATDASVKTDGEDGIDNSFGANLLPVLEGFAPNLSLDINENIRSGRYSFLLEVERLGGAADYIGLPASLYFGAKLGAPPVWDGSDEWPLYCELMRDCQDAGTKQLSEGNESIVQFQTSYVTGRTWVSGSKTSATLTLTVQGIQIRLDIGQAVMSLEFDDANTTGTNGVMAGVIDTTHLIGTVAQLAGRLSTTLCDGATLEALKRNLRAASDIMVDGSQDPNAACDGISVGIGFEMKRAKLGVVQDALENEPDPCEEM